MRIAIESLGAPPEEYDQKYLANLVRALEVALRRYNVAPLYAPDSKTPSATDRSHVLYSDGSILLDPDYTPKDPHGLVPKEYADDIVEAILKIIEQLHDVVLEGIEVYVAIADGDGDISTLEVGALVDGDSTIAADVAAMNWEGHPHADGTALRIKPNHVVTFGNRTDVAYTWVGPTDVSVGFRGSYDPVNADFVATGANDHSLLVNVSPNQHHNQAHSWNGPDHPDLPATFPPSSHGHEAIEIAFDNTIKGKLFAVQVQAALDELTDLSNVIQYGAVAINGVGDGTIEGDVNATNWSGHTHADGTALYIEANHIVMFGHGTDTAYMWVGPKDVRVGSGGDYTSIDDDYQAVGTADHSILTNRDQPNQHTMESITGLVADQIRQDEALASLKLNDLVDVVAGSGAWGEAGFSAGNFGSGALHQQGIFLNEATQHWEDDYRSKFITPYVLGATYYPQNEVLDGSYLMAANKVTTEPAAPQKVGLPSFIITDPVLWTNKSNAQPIHVGMHILVPSGKLYQISAYRIWAENTNADYTYTLWAITPDGSGGSIYEQKGVITGGDLQLGWNQFSYNGGLLLPGAEADLILEISNSANGQTVTGGWTREADSNVNSPSSQGWNKDNNSTILRISITDLDSDDRQNELMSIVAGSDIRFVDTLDSQFSVTYAVMADPVLGAGVVTYTISEVQQGPSGVPGVASTTTMTAEVPTPSVVNYVDVADKVLLYPNITGRRSLTGAYADAVDTQDGYQFDIELQEMTASNDWNVKAVSDSGGSSAGGSGGLEPHTIDYHSDVTTDTPIAGQVLQWDGSAWINATSSAGVTDHELLDNVLSDQHHNQIHAWNGTDHTGVPSVFPPEDHTHEYADIIDPPIIPPAQTYLHEDLTDVSADQHHPQLHTVESHSDVTLTSPVADEVLSWDGAKWINKFVSSGGGVTDHGALTGLLDDDHPQYHNDIRGDARYSPLGHGHAHSDLTDIGVDDHHAKLHAHDGIDGSGQVDYSNILNSPTIPAPQTFLHEDLTDVTEDQHHPKLHTIESHNDVVLSAIQINHILKWNGANWINAVDETGTGGGGGSMTVSDTPPAGPADGDQWLDSKTGLASVWYIDADGGQWISDPYVAEEVAAAFLTSVNGDVGPDVTLTAADVGASPSGHNHDGTYAPDSHAHAIADVTGLQTALDGKSATGHDHAGDYEPANANIQAHIGVVAGNPHGTTADDIGAVISNTAGLTMEVVATLPGTQTPGVIYVVTT